MMFSPILFILPLALAYTEDCYTFEAPQCDGDAVMCDMGYDDNGCHMGSYCAYPDGDCPALCSAYCGSHDAYCDYGYDDNGCHLGSYCAPGYPVGDFQCMGVCPENCGEGESWCENPPDANGCMTGNWCAPEGTECPHVCPHVPYAECDWETEFSCWGGEDENGCPMGDWCVPHHNGMIGDDGEPCWSVCEAGACYGDGAVVCDNGYYNGCWMGNYCNKPYGDCPAVCYESCDYGNGQTYCDYGMDDNGCWMGNYCATECYDTTAM